MHHSKIGRTTLMLLAGITLIGAAACAPHYELSKCQELAADSVGLSAATQFAYVPESGDDIMSLIEDARDLVGYCVPEAYTADRITFKPSDSCSDVLRQPETSLLLPALGEGCTTEELGITCVKSSVLFTILFPQTIPEKYPAETAKK